MSSQPLSFVAFDLETTSRFVSTARVVEWAVVTFTSQSLRSQNYAVTTKLSSRVDPGEAIPREASAIHGVYDADVVTAPTTTQSLPVLLAALRSQVVVGYNIEQYDFPCLHAECRRCGLGDVYDDMLCSLRGIVDVMPWAARTTKAPQYRRGARTLATMSSRHGVVLESAHSACDDAEASGRLMLSLMTSGHMPLELGDVVEATKATWSSLRRRR